MKISGTNLSPWSHRPAGIRLSTAVGQNHRKVGQGDRPDQKEPAPRRRGRNGGKEAGGAHQHGEQIATLPPALVLAQRRGRARDRMDLVLGLAHITTLFLVAVARYLNQQSFALVKCQARQWNS